MKQGNLETLVSACAGGSCDRKIACETLAEDLDQDGGDRIPPEKVEEEEIPPDFPPESFWLSKDAEFDWFDRNAFYERKDSQKGNSVSNSTNLNPNLNRNGNSSSQRFVKKPKPSFFSLLKPQNSCYVDAKSRRKCKAVGNIRLFPKRSGSTNKSDAAALVEPSSPKVSCMGRVRSKRDRNRRLKSRQVSAESEKAKNEKTAEKRKTSFLSTFRAMFGSPGKPRDAHATPAKSPPRNSISDIRTRLPPYDSDAISESTSPPRASVDSVGLGGMKRFASGRRSEPLI